MNIHGVIIGLLVSVLICSFVSLSQAQTETRAIEEITIRGYRTVPIEEIRGRITSKKGDKFSAEVAYQDFERVMNIPAFDREGSQLIIEYGVGGDIHITFVLKEQPPKR